MSGHISIHGMVNMYIIMSFFDSIQSILQNLKITSKLSREDRYYITTLKKRTFRKRPHVTSCGKKMMIERQIHGITDSENYLHNVK